MELPDPTRVTLGNGAQLCIVDASAQPVVKLEVLFEAGRWHEHRASVSQAVNALWREGTEDISGADAAERIDFYGATLQGFSSLDYSGFTLYVLEKFLPEVLPLVFDLVIAPDFPRRELETFVERAIAQLRINADKPDVQSYRLLTEALFGVSHPYGYNSTEASLRSLTRADLQRHHRLHYRAGNAIAFASGKVSEASRACIAEQLERLPAGSSIANDNVPHPLPGREFRLGLPRSLQSAIRLGRPVGGRSDPDYPGLFVLNTVLGGYFGSRLMTELREERGLTYNIDSSIDTMRFGAYLSVSAEVAGEQVAEALAAIREEMDSLRGALIDAEELEMVRAYLMGSYLSMVDGPINTAESVRTLLTEDAQLSYFARLVETTRTITATELRHLAREYLNPEEWIEVVVGP